MKWTRKQRFEVKHGPQGRVYCCCNRHMPDGKRGKVADLRGNAGLQRSRHKQGLRDPKA